ncbi:Transmembrane protein 65 [Trichinella zimbabwensis]|uniref:Transmembrane protein 65 n=1 Tax=Trichinella zimbabwensis TaxID=268475 RepID=A0A0V1HDP7_9BILA|nr:Transmembrane protein 65 [Trichinella zimbabwensis]
MTITSWCFLVVNCYHCFIMSNNLAMKFSLWNSLQACRLPDAPETEQKLELLLKDGPNAAEFTNFVVTLCNELRKAAMLKTQVHPPSDVNKLDSFVQELKDLLEELDCSPSDLFGTNLDECLSSMQLRSALISNSTSVAEELNSLCTSVGISRLPDNISMEQFFDLILPKIEELVKKIPNKSALFKGTLTKEQWNTVECLNDRLRTEYKLRAEMLLKRLDVTVKSFLWNERVKEKEEEIMQIYKPLRTPLNSDIQVTVAEVLAARDDLPLIEMTYGVSAGEKRITKIHKMIMEGKIPDRGGRTSEIQPPPPEMPSWQKRVTGRGGGSHAGRRGRGGWSGQQSHAGGQHYSQTAHEYYYQEGYGHSQRGRGHFVEFVECEVSSAQTLLTINRHGLHRTWRTSDRYGRYVWLNLDTKYDAHFFLQTLSSNERRALLECIQEEAQFARLLVSRDRVSTNQLKVIFFRNMIPFLGFGLFDNLIMIIAGEYIDITVGTLLGISTLAAAGVGNMISDVGGVGISHYIEQIVSKMRWETPNLTPEQWNSKRVRWTSNAGRVLGVSLGCLIGMFPLLFFKDRQKPEYDTTDEAP